MTLWFELEDVGVVDYRVVSLTPPFDIYALVDYEKTAKATVKGEERRWVKCRVEVGNMADDVNDALFTVDFNCPREDYSCGDGFAEVVMRILVGCIHAAAKQDVSNVYIRTREVVIAAHQYWANDDGSPEGYAAWIVEKPAGCHINDYINGRRSDKQV